MAAKVSGTLASESISSSVKFLISAQSQLSTLHVLNGVEDNNSIE